MGKQDGCVVILECLEARFITLATQTAVKAVLPRGTLIGIDSYRAQILKLQITASFMGSNQVNIDGDQFRGKKREGGGLTRARRQSASLHSTSGSQIPLALARSRSTVIFREVWSSK